MQKQKVKIEGTLFHGNFSNLSKEKNKHSLRNSLDTQNLKRKNQNLTEFFNAKNLSRQPRGRHPLKLSNRVRLNRGSNLDLKKLKKTSATFSNLKRKTTKRFRVIKTIKRYRNPWGQTLKIYKKRYSNSFFKFQKRYTVMGKLKRARYSYYRSLDYFFTNVMWMKKGLQKLNGSMHKHHLNMFYKQSLSRVGRLDNIFEKFFGKLERLLPVALFRLRLVPGVKTAKEYIKHGHVFVNNRIITHVNYVLYPGDIITLSNKLKKKFRRKYKKHRHHRYRFRNKRKRVEPRIIKIRRLREHVATLKFRFRKKRRIKPFLFRRTRRPRYFEFSRKLRSAILLYSPAFYEVPYNKYRFTFNMYLFLLNNFKYVRY